MVTAQCSSSCGICAFEGVTSVDFLYRKWSVNAGRIDNGAVFVLLLPGDDHIIGRVAVGDFGVRGERGTDTASAAAWAVQSALPIGIAFLIVQVSRATEELAWPRARDSGRYERAGRPGARRSGKLIIA